jgi:hypothetical protein
LPNDDDIIPRVESLTDTGGVRRKRSRAVILLLALWLWACAGGTAAPTAAPGAPLPGETPSAAPTLVLSSGPLVVTLTSPADEAVVSTPQVDVAGQAPAETVISIGDSITVVDASGQFSIPVPLEEGPNALEIVASDPDGNQASVTLVVTYDPGS